jgi:DNA polymerase-1
VPKQKKLVVIDGYSLLFRAFFGTRYLSTSDGRPTNALFGFVSMLYNLLEKERPECIVVAFDAPGKTFRDHEYAEYKGTRSETPSELVSQLKASRELIQAFGIPSIELTGFEADDVIGTLTLDAEKNGYDSIIVTGDLDSLQLVDDHVKVMTTRTGVTDVVYYDPAAVQERFGFGPEYLADYKALVGDSSDNIPGVPGVGPKTASTLINQFGHIEQMIDRLGEVEQKYRKKLEPYVDQMPKSKWLATIVRDAPVTFDYKPYRVSKEQMDAAHKLMEWLEFRMHAKKLDSILSPYAGDEQRGLFDEGAPVLVEAERPHVAVSQVTTPEAALHWLGGRRGALYSGDDGHSLASGLEAVDITTDTAGAIVAKATESLAFHHSKPLLRAHKNYAVPGFDSLLAAYVLQSSRSSYNLGDLAQGYLEESPPVTPAEKASAISRLEPVLTERLEKESQWSVYSEIDLPLAPILAEMENFGVAVDVGLLQEFSKSLETQIEQIGSAIFEMAGETFNIGSPQQIGRILFDKLGLPSGKKNKTGFSTGVEVLQQLAPQYDICREILNWRELTKLKNTYADSLPKSVAEDGRIHTTYAQHIAATGRLSSIDPNLQNIPIRSEMGREIRRAFVAAPGYQLASLDYSQIELRLLAHYCKEPALVEAFTKGTDVHAVTASLMWNEPLETVSKAHRRYSKMLNYAVLYGVTDFGLANQLGGEFTVGQAKDLIQNYFERFPKVREYIDATLEEARSKGFTTTLTGRRRYFQDIYAGNRVARQYAERQAINAPLQGGSADMIKLAMLRIRPILAGMRTRMLLQVHDELLFELAQGEESIVPALKEAMETALPLEVPVEVDASVGPNWLETKGA